MFSNFPSWHSKFECRRPGVGEEIKKAKGKNVELFLFNSIPLLQLPRKRESADL
jgi:hypothetical protein